MAKVKGKRHAAEALVPGGVLHRTENHPTHSATDLQVVDGLAGPHAVEHLVGLRHGQGQERSCLCVVNVARLGAVHDQGLACSWTDAGHG